MTIDQFWYEDSELMHCYVKAYYAKLHKQSWVNGIYTHQAVGTALADMMPLMIQRGLGMLKDKKVIKHLNDIKYFDRPIPDLIVKDKAQSIIKEMNEDELMELNRRLSNKFK